MSTGTIEATGASLSATVLALLAVALCGCERAGGVRLVPVYPDDRPALLTELGVESLEIRFQPADAKSGNQAQWTTVERGGGLSHRLAPGSWRASVRGVGSAAEARGETAVFEVEAGVDHDVRFFLGEVGAFNLVRLEPAEVADQLGDLAGHTATPYLAADGGQRILVAGGRRGEVGSSDAFIIDPARFAIQRAPSLSCARAGHTALLVENDDGLRVVLAGGDGEGSCDNELDVFDPERESFARVAVCGISDARPVVAEVTQLTDRLARTGRVIAPGNPRCVVDVFTGFSEHDLQQADPGPDAPHYAVANSQGQVLVVTSQRLFIDGAKRGSHCLDGQSWRKEATWLGIEERVGGRLVVLDNEQFLFVGGRLPGGGVPNHEWTIVSLLRDCELARVVEGVRADDVLPGDGFVLVDLGSGSSMTMLVAGGTDAAGGPLDRVALLSQPPQASAPTVHDLSSAERERPVRLSMPRSGAATAVTSDGGIWIIGGGDPRPEIFVGGIGVAVNWERFARRKPTMRLAWVLDNGVGAPSQWFDLFLPDFRDRVVKRIVHEFYSDLRTMVLLAANSGRALDLDDFGVELEELNDGRGCGDSPMPISVVITGDTKDVSLPGGTVEIPDEGQSGSPPGLDEEINKVFAKLEQERSGCAWRHFFRRAFDGVSQTISDATGTIDLSTGITLVLFGARDDDCSQGVLGDGGSFAGIPPSAGTLADYHCTVTPESEEQVTAAAEYDAYFGLPPTDSSAEDLRRIVEDISWDPEDAIFASFGRHSTDCGGSLYTDLQPTRRLRETLDWIGDHGRGVRTALLDLCGIGAGTDLDQLAEEVASLVRRQLPWQACVGMAIAESKADYDQDRGEFVPVPRPGPEDEDPVADRVRGLCRAVTVVQVTADGKYYRVVPVTLDGCWSGTDSDRRGGCAADESGWMLRCDRLSTVLGTVTGNAEFICLP